ncbi:hypothetical protein EI94DRAFT_318783 [Lactarius quietus]|nr:hypothetical protein EI94DRAFT_522663 [Lactarius quietus]KAF8265547.1 hypothetical protein EI94DRAFT_318783 [Lactarius quietus]
MDCNTDTFFNPYRSCDNPRQEYPVSMEYNEGDFFNRPSSFHGSQQSVLQVRPLASSILPLDGRSCPKCWKKFGRWQDRDRHLLSCHLPRSLYCPYPSCSWRGDRTDLFRQHWNAHGCGPVPEQAEYYQIYPSKMILEWITHGRVSTDVAAECALLFAEEKARRLGKLEAWKDLWGRKGKVGRGEKAVPSTDFPIATDYDGVGLLHHIHHS